MTFACQWIQHVSTGPSRHAPKRPPPRSTKASNQVKDVGKLATSFNCRFQETASLGFQLSCCRAALAPWPSYLSPFSRFLGHPLPSAASTASPCTFHGLNGRVSTLHLPLDGRSSTLFHVAHAFRTRKPKKTRPISSTFFDRVVPTHFTSRLRQTSAVCVTATFLPGRLYCPIGDGERTVVIRLLWQVQTLSLSRKEPAG